MFQLSVQDIHPGQQAGNKEEAIRQVAAALVSAGNVADGYVNGMLAREQQTSTFLGNGIAIPHGTTDTRDQVLKTGVQVFQFPQGVTWGEGQTAYVAIGIAASSDEHLGLLRQLTHVLSDDAVAAQLQSATTAEELRALLMGEKQSEALKLDNETLSLDVAASDLLTLQALNAARLKEVGAADTAFVSHAINDTPLNLGQGVWLTDSAEGNLRSAVVNTIKQFSSDITVTNLDGSGKPANGRSLMKVVALGVKKGHRLRFTAQGEDAQQALDAIGEAIAAGLGEGA